MVFISSNGFLDKHVLLKFSHLVLSNSITKTFNKSFRLHGKIFFCLSLVVPHKINVKRRLVVFTPKYPFRGLFTTSFVCTETDSLIKR